MKKLYSFLLLASVLLLCSCGKETPAAEEQPAAETRHISSIQYYNKTGKMQREDLYEYDSSGQGQVTAQIVYTYNDLGKLTNIKKEAGGAGYDKDIESYFYMGENCTQKIIFNENGSSSEAYYWKYYSNGTVKSETYTRMLTPSSKIEEVKEYDEASVLTRSTETSSEGYRYTDYIYSEETALLEQEDTYFSLTGKKADYELESTLQYFYNEAQRLIKTIRTDPDGTVIECTIYEYDEASNLISQKTYSSADISDASLILGINTEYDALGEVIFTAETDNQGAGQSVEYRYDALGNITRQIDRTFGETESEIITSTEYNSHNNPIKQTVSTNGSLPLTQFECEYTYYDSGSIKTCTYYSVY